jgi:hypothetical protein
MVYAEHRILNRGGFMNQILRGITLAAFCILLFGCGSQEEEPAVQVKSEPAAAKEPSASNPFADEQQLIRDAKKIQGLLDEDAEEKKKAHANID